MTELLAKEMLIHQRLQIKKHFLANVKTKLIFCNFDITKLIFSILIWFHK